MKIVHICMAQYSDGWNYQENLLTKYHIKLGYEVTLISSLFCYKEGILVEDNRTSFLDINGCKIIRLRRKSNGFMNRMPTYDCFYDTLCKEKPDIIFSHGCQYKDSALLAKYVKKHSEVKLFVDNHADFSNSATNFFSKIVLHKIIWRHYAHILLPYTQKFWGVLPARVDFLTNIYKIPKEKCDLLVMGADDEFVDKSNMKIRIRKLREKYGIKDEDFLIVTGGKIDIAKIQTELLIKAVLLQKRKEIKLLFFGSIAEEIKNRIFSLVDNQRVIYVGWITPDETFDYFAIADLVIFPGRHSVFWEQVAGQGIPMIVKYWPGIQHIDIGGNVLYITEDSVDEIKDKIENLVNNPQKYETMKSIAVERGKKFFSYKEIATCSILVNEDSD